MCAKLRLQLSERFKWKVDWKLSNLCEKTRTDTWWNIAGQWFSAVTIDTSEDLLASINKQYRIHWYPRLEVKNSNKILQE